MGSQPAVDCASSSDPIFGWGPSSGGNVFQKGFVEFFCDEGTVRELEKRVQGAGGWVTWFATSAQVS